MAIIDPIMLPPDLLIVPVGDLPDHVREQLEFEEGDFAVTRPGARTPSRIIDSQAAEFLAEFRSPKTIVEAVIDYSLSRKINAEETLEEAYPLVQRFIRAGMLVLPDSEEARKITPSFEIGEYAGDLRIVRCLQVLDDTELYQVRRPDGSEAALKIERRSEDHNYRGFLYREAAVLRQLDGIVSPRLLDEDVLGGKRFLLLEWCPGVTAEIAAEELRRWPGVGNAEGRKRALDLCCTILKAFAHLHAQGAVHSDIHPRNVLVQADSSVKIVDYGLTRFTTSDEGLSRAQRGGIGFFFEPEYAQARLAEKRPPPSTMLGEQYGLAAMLYFLLTGAHYLRFSVEKAKMLKQIAEEEPLPFSSVGSRPWPQVERILAKALSKDPSDRFQSVAEFAQSLAEASTEEPEEGAVESDHDMSAIMTRPEAARELLTNVLAELDLSGELYLSQSRTAPTCSVMYGAAGIAYTLYRIALIRDDNRLLSLADIWSTRALNNATRPEAFYASDIDLTPETLGDISPYHTKSGVHCIRALVANAMGDQVSQQEAVEAFISTSKGTFENIDLTLGRAGTLLTSSLLLDSMPNSPLIDREGLRLFGDEALRLIWEQLGKFPPIETCHQLPFLGIAHGWAGVLYATLRWCEATGSSVDELLNSKGIFQERLEQLAVYAESYGRGVRWRRKLPVSAYGGSGDYMEGWCHGSAGHVFLWTLAHSFFRDARYLELAEKSAWYAWESPDGISDLCCGLAGRAYALLNLYKHTGEESWLARASDLVERAAIGIESWALRSDSLYKGRIGVALLAAELSRPELSCMPLFEKEGWS